MNASKKQACCCCILSCAPKDWMRDVLEDSVEERDLSCGWSLWKGPAVPSPLPCGCGACSGPRTDPDLVSPNEPDSFRRPSAMLEAAEAARKARASIDGSGCCCCCMS